MPGFFSARNAAIVAFSTLSLSVTAFAQEAPPAATPEPPPAAPAEPMPRVALQTSMGQIVLELNSERAPATVANFLRYVMDGHFNSTVIYRVVPRFVIQGGSVGSDGNGKPVREPIPLEANNGLPNLRGTITMARAADPNSATAEFFINLVDNYGLNQEMGDTNNQTGYAVFGRVAEGMQVIDLITTLPLGGGYGPFPQNAPLIPVIIRQAVILDAAAAAPTPAPAAAPVPMP
jgi:peptidyl-prolyl cis-trans isomerase A (cyclophilin A)